MSIHLQSGNLFYDNFNTQENCYDFLLNQQDKKKVIIKKKTAYYKTFKRYYFHYEKIDKFDLFSDKNAKYLFCKSNAYLEGTHQPKKSGRHTIKVNGKFSLGKLQEVSWQYVLTGCHILLLYYRFPTVTFLLLLMVKKYRLKNYMKIFADGFSRDRFGPVFMSVKSFFRW